MKVLSKRILMTGLILLLNACIPPPFFPHSGRYQGGYNGGSPSGYRGSYGSGYSNAHGGDSRHRERYDGDHHNDEHRGSQYSDGRYSGR